MRGLKSHDAVHRFYREHGETRNLLPLTPSQPARLHLLRRLRFARGARTALEIMQNA